MIENYKDLVVHIIAREIEDFLRNTDNYKACTDEEAENQLYYFCTNSPWFNYVDLNGVYLYEKSLELKKEGRRKLWL